MFEMTVYSHAPSVGTGMNADQAQEPESESSLVFLADADPLVDPHCYFCGQNLSLRFGLGLCAGPALRTAQGDKPVCAACGRRLAPALSALLELAQTAQRIGRVHGRTPLRVTMEALLELARVSERYSSLVSL